MEVFETERINIRARYDIENGKTEGEVYSKIEGSNQVRVGLVIEESYGKWCLCLFPTHCIKSYIEEDYEKLKPDFVEYANMWKERAKRGIC